MTDEAKLAELAALMEQAAALKRFRAMDFYKPTPKQVDFHNAGLRFRQRMLAAGNQTGKTYSAGMEVAYHMTGEYPDWWHGRRFKRAVTGWAGGVTAVSTRDNPQRILLGRKRLWGTGTIPKDRLIGNPVLARGEPDSVDSFVVRHVSGGESTLYFKNYAQGREKWQGETLDFTWMDEEPPYDIYEEALTRLNRRKGLMLITFTPLLGATEVVNKFFEPDANDKGAKNRKLINMTLEDATFYTKEEREEIENQYPAWMRRARVMGLPVMGEGLVYPLLDETISVPAFKIPRHFRRIAGLDFGTSHPKATVWLAYDPDTDIIYVYDVYKSDEDDIVHHADAIKTRGDWIPVAWPHDGLKSDAGSGKTLMGLYKEKKVNMLRDSARYDNDTGGSQPIEPMVDMILDRMKSGRFKVFDHLREWFKEKNSYHRKDGKIVDYNDDIMAATRYGVMMLRFARTHTETSTLAKSSEDYDPLEAW